MNLAESFRIALRALRGNKVRSALTMLGVMIGVAAVILLVAIGTGVRTEVTSSIEGLGSNLLFVFPGKISGGQRGGGVGGADIRKRFTLDDVNYLSSRLGAQAIVVPILQAPTTARHLNRSIDTQIAASSDQGNSVFNATYVFGRHYSRSEYVSGARVVDLGSTVRDALFPGAQNPVGETISVNGQPFTVVGVLAARGGSLTGNQDNQIYMPATSAEQLLGVSEISSIGVKANNANDIENIKVQLQRLLAPRYTDQFTVFTQAQTLGILSTLLGTLTVMLAGIASISLLVGGIGIMNIMLVSVTERTREIGIRKAVGARTFDILSQFVIEAVVLSVVGGLLGIALGWVGAIALRSVVSTQVTWWAIGLAFLFSAGVGVFFGVYPAWRASQLDPITALGYE